MEKSCEYKVDFNNPLWLKNYDKHVPSRIEVPDKTLHSYLIDSAEKYPEKPAFTFFDYSMTYKGLLNETYKTVELFRKLDVKYKDCVALILPNTPHFIISSYAAMMLGARICPLNPLSSPYQIENQIKEYKPKIIIVQDLLYDKVSELEDIDPKDIIIAKIDDYASFKIKLYMAIASLLGKIKNIPAIHPRFRDLVKNISVSNPSLPEINPEKTVAAMLLTGGTTGEPRW